MDGYILFYGGTELKRELVEGELSDHSQLVLPTAGAIGGMLVSALFYIAFNKGDAVAMNGWAIPAATDIAFALGILAGSILSGVIAYFYLRSVLAKRE